MKFVVNSNVLLKQITATIKFVDSNPITPLLESFLFRLNDDEVSISVDELRPIKLNDGINAVITLHSVKTTNHIDEVDELILEIYKDKAKLFSVHHYDFERITRKLFIGLGYIVTPTKKTRDGGYDMIAEKRDVIPVTHLIECKSSQKNKPVTIKEVRALYGTINEMNAHAGVLVTNSSFTKAVKDFVKNLFGRIVLIDHTKFSELIYKHAIGLLAI